MGKRGKGGEGGGGKWGKGEEDKEGEWGRGEKEKEEEEGNGEKEKKKGERSGVDLVKKDRMFLFCLKDDEISFAFKWKMLRASSTIYIYVYIDNRFKSYPQRSAY